MLFAVLTLLKNIKYVHCFSPLSLLVVYTRWAIKRGTLCFSNNLHLPSAGNLLETYLLYIASDTEQLKI